MLAGHDRKHAGQVECPLARQAAMAQRVVQQRADRLGQSVADLQSEDALAGYLLEQAVIARTSEVMPRIEHEPSVRAVCRADNIPGGCQVRDAAERRELQVDPHVGARGPVAHRGERLDQLVDLVVRPERLVDGDCFQLQCVDDGEQLVFAEANPLETIAWDAGRRLPARKPAREWVQRGQPDARLLVERDDVGIAQTAVAGLRVVGREQRQILEATRPSRLDPLLERARNERSGPEEGVVHSMRRGSGWLRHAAYQAFGRRWLTPAHDLL